MPLDAVPPTPAQPQEPDFRIHWLSASLDQNPYFKPSDLFALVSISFNTDLVDTGHGLNGYRTCYAGVGGVKVLLDPSTSNQPIAHLIVPGEACEAVGLQKLQEIACVDNLRLTRLDLAFDHCPFTPSEMLADWQAGNIRTHVQQKSWKHMLNDEGETVYLGSQKATQQICCYSMRGYTRLELRLKGERAEKTKSTLFECPDDMKQTALGILCNMVEFVDANAEQTITRCPRLGWWQNF